MNETAYVYVNSNSGYILLENFTMILDINGYIELVFSRFIFSATGSGYTLPPRDGKNEIIIFFINNEKSEE